MVEVNTDLESNCQGCQAYPGPHPGSQGEDPCNIAEFAKLFWMPGIDEAVGKANDCCEVNQLKVFIFHAFVVANQMSTASIDL